MKAASNVDGICMIGVAAFLLTSAMRVFACQNSCYWITYMNQQNGESFYTRFEHAESLPGSLELQINHLGGQCYLVDVERNSTKPPTAPSKPRTN